MRLKSGSRVGVEVTVEIMKTRAISNLPIAIGLSSQYERKQKDGRSQGKICSGAKNSTRHRPTAIVQYEQDSRR